MILFKLIFLSTTIFYSKFSYSKDNHSGLPQLDLDTYPSLVFWSIVSLIIGYFLMKYVVTPNLKSIFNLRETTIQNDLVKAKASNQENKKIKQEIYDNQQNVKLKSQKIIDDAIAESRNLIEKSQIEISKKMELKITNAEKRIKKIEKQAILDIVASSDDLTSKIVYKFTNITNDKVNIKRVIKSASDSVLLEK